MAVRNIFPVILACGLLPWAVQAQDSTGPASVAASDPPAASIADEASAQVAAQQAEEKAFRTPAGYKKKKKKDGAIFYCRSETPIGSRFPQEYCFTQAQLERIDKSKKGMQDDVAMRQRMCTTGAACGGN
jgi:hypothetical protein